LNFAICLTSWTDAEALGPPQSLWKAEEPLEPQQNRFDIRRSGWTAGETIEPQQSGLNRHDAVWTVADPLEPSRNHLENNRIVRLKTMKSHQDVR
jgi:hypothetical protein